MAGVECAHQSVGGLDTRPAKRLRPHPPFCWSALYRGSSAEEGVDIAGNDGLVTALILLLAACEQAAQELGHSEVAVDGLGAELEALGGRLRDLLSQDRLKAD